MLWVSEKTGSQGGTVTKEQAIENYLSVKRAYDVMADKADAAFLRYFEKLQNGERTNAAQATRLANETSYLSADLSHAEGKLWAHGIDPETIGKEAS